jgi:hypothetical protein
LLCGMCTPEGAIEKPLIRAANDSPQGTRK